MKDFRKTEAVIFDLDGTLLNTIDDLADSCNKTLSQLGMPARTIEEVRCFVGNGIARLIELAIPNGKENPEFEKAVKLMKKNYGDNWHNKTRPYDGIMELIRELKNRGIKIGINSNKPDPQVKELANLYFSDVVGNDTAVGEKNGFKRKPSPDLVNEILSIMNVSRENAVYVGDSEVDIATARNAGIKCISVTWGFRSRQLLEQHGAVFFASTPMEILDLIDS